MGDQNPKFGVAVRKITPVMKVKVIATKTRSAKELLSVEEIIATGEDFPGEEPTVVKLVNNIDFVNKLHRCIFIN